MVWKPAFLLVTLTQKLLLVRCIDIELNNLAWSLARLLGNPNSGDRLQPNRFFDLMEGIGRELCDTRRKATSQV